MVRGRAPSDGFPHTLTPIKVERLIAKPFTDMLLELNLKDQISFNAVGLGAPAKDFVILNGLVDAAKRGGKANANSQFPHSKAACGAPSTVMEGCIIDHADCHSNNNNDCRQ